MSLLKKTNRWVENKLISPEQAQAIVTFEKSHNNGTFWRVAFIIAGTLIGLGIISLVAANWEVFPDCLKLTGFFLLLSGLSGATYWNLLHEHIGWKEFFAVLSFLMIAATIGLIAQLFNLDGGWHSFVLAWTMLGLPFLIASRSTWFHIVWLVLFISQFTHLEHLLEMGFLTFDTTLLSIGILSLLCYAAGQLDKHLHSYTLFPKAFARMTLWATYLAVAWLACYFGIWHKGIGAIAVVFVCAGLRLFWAVHKQDISSFKRNALLTEIYIFIIFISTFSSLFMSGIGFILGGLLILGLIYLLRKTLQRIKTMEAFQ